MTWRAFINFLMEAEVPQADEIRDTIIEDAARIMEFPSKSTLVRRSPEGVEVRDFLSKHYCLRYGLFGDVVCILRIWHYRENERNEL